MNDRNRSDLLSSAMLAMSKVSRAATPAEAAAHRTAYQGFLDAAHAAPWQLPCLRIVS